jgi:hypothetical protein
LKSYSIYVAIISINGIVEAYANATYSTETSTSSSTYSDSGLSASITPSSSSSKILVIVDVQGGKTTGVTGLDLKLLRGSTDLIIFAKASGYNGGTSYNLVGSSSCCYLDSPATTSSTTYKVQLASNSNVSTARINDNSSVSTISLMEIAA